MLTSVLLAGERARLLLERPLSMIVPAGTVVLTCVFTLPAVVSVYYMCLYYLSTSLFRRHPGRQILSISGYPEKITILGYHVTTVISLGSLALTVYSLLTIG